MIVRNVTGLDGVEVWGNLHANYIRSTLGENVACAVRMHVSESSEGRKSCEGAIMQWEATWKKMPTKLEGGARIPDLWKMLALVEMCPKDVKG